MGKLADTIWQDVRYGLRMLGKSPGFTAVAVLSLALGIGANTAIFSILDAVMLRYLPVREPEQLLQLTMGKSATFTNPIWEQLRDRQDVFSGIFAFSTPRFNLARGGEAEYADGLWASGDFFSTLGVQPAAGRLLGAADDRRGCAAVAVLGYGFWQKRYGGERRALGSTLTLDGRPFEIGVAAPGFFGVEVGRTFEVAIPICAEPILRGENSALDRRNFWWLRVMGRLPPGRSPEQAAARLKVLAPAVFEATVPQNWRQEYQQEYRRRSFDTVPAATGLSFVRARYRNSILMLMAVVAIVLLIACANIANLMLARATTRAKEMAVRLALGASRGRLLRQLLTESVLLSLAGAALGILFARWGAALLVQYISSTSNQVFLDLGLDARLLGFTAGVAVLAGVLSGLAPGFRAAGLAPGAALKENSRSATGSRARFGLGRMLVVTQVALSLVLLIGAGLFVRSFWNLVRLDAGFQRDRVLIVSVDIRNGSYPVERRPAVFAELLERVRSIPGVRSASQSSITPISGNSWNETIHVEGYQPKSRSDPEVWFNRVSPQYFETLATPLLAGRDFDGRDTATSPPVAIVNETMARRFFPNANPVGRSFRTEESSGKLAAPTEIIGLVKDAKYQDLREQILATAYVPVSQEPRPGLSGTLEVRTTGAPAAVVPQVKDAVAAVNRDISLGFKTLATQVNESLLQERLVATLSGFFGGLALLLATVGLYGVMSYMVTRRRNEIGIRMALGAQQSSVLWLVLREVALLVSGGLAIGLAGALATTHLVGKMLYGLASRDALTMALAALLLAGVAAVAGYVPAKRAARVDPMAALREE